MTKSRIPRLLATLGISLSKGKFRFSLECVLAPQAGFTIFEIATTYRFAVGLAMTESLFVII